MGGFGIDRLRSDKPHSTCGWGNKITLKVKTLNRLDGHRFNHQFPQDLAITVLIKRDADLQQIIGFMKGEFAIPFHTPKNSKKMKAKKHKKTILLTREETRSFLRIPLAALHRWTNE